MTKELSKNSKIQKNQLIDTGMILQKGTKLFDRFRDRIMFPIHNRKGQIVAFGGRSLNNQMPKYLNSPETELFHKSRELYGLYQVLQTHQSIDQMIIVEGYMDVITLNQFGVTNVVATLGTAISQQHIHTLLRYTQKLIFCFDGDLAGKKAAWRALEIILPLMNEGNDVGFSFLPGGDDPDSFIRRVGNQTFLQQLKTSMPLVDFFFNKLKAQIAQIETIAGKTRLAYMADKFLQKIPPGIFQELMYSQLSQTIGLSLTKVQEILKKASGPSPKKQTSTTYHKMLAPIRLAIGLLIQNPKLLEKILIPATFNSMELQGIDILKRVIGVIKQNSQQTTGSLLEFFKGEEDFSVISSLAAMDLLIPEDAWQAELQGAFDCIMGMEKEEHIRQLISKGNEQGLTAEEKQLLQQLLVARMQ